MTRAGSAAACVVEGKKKKPSLPLFPFPLLPSHRGCLKLPSLTLFTFSLFYCYQEEMA